MPNRAGRAYYWIIASVFLAASMLPYLYAVLNSGDGRVFGGFLFNPIDGNSYLAKMEQGCSGAWQFTLPFTAETSSGSFLFLYYLLLGHAARWSGLPLLWVYHLARLSGCAVLMAGLVRYITRSLGEGSAARLAFLLIAFGSGMGWLALPAGKFTADFWVAEAYPYLSALAAPHFSLGLGLVLVLLAPPSDRPVALAAARLVRLGRAAATILLAFCLAIISPFGIVVVVVALAAPDLRALFPISRKTLQNTFTGSLPWVVLGGGPWLIYYVWVTRSDPLLAGWNAQNLTPTPPVWDLVLAFSPLLLLALPAAFTALRIGPAAVRRVAAWLFLGIILLFLPLGLQRRFMLGLYIPIGVLGVWLLACLVKMDRRLWLAGILLLAFSLPTNLILMFSIQQAIASRDLSLYYTQGEAQAFAWIADHTPPDTLILAAPDTGLLLPAHTGRRVIYGHPFETVNAAVEKTAVEAYFAAPDLNFLDQHHVDVVFFGPREQLLGGPALQGLPVLYTSPGVTVYAAP